MRTKFICVILLLFAVVGLSFGETGLKKKRPLPHDYGLVVMNNQSEKTGMAAVSFDHWLHRMKFTCRLCHVDIGFAMKAGATRVSAVDNMKGFYCGVCHDGKRVIDGKKIFAACARRSPLDDTRDCSRCHSVGVKQAPKSYDFKKMTEPLPKERFGNGLNWEKAEIDGIIKPIDFLEGVSFKRQPLEIQKDFSLTAKESGMPDIIFSHRKHTVWNGCEVCHPEIFIGVKKGLTKYSMPDIYEGKYCGVCHGSVAFPLLDCQRCHTKPVQ